MDKNVKTYLEFINETEIPAIYNTNFQGMVQGAIANIHAQIMAIATQLAEEKKARNPYRYGDKDTIVEEVDITRALNIVFHSNWKKLLKSGDVQNWAKASVERAQKLDDRSNKKNERARRKLGGDKQDNYNVQFQSQEMSRNTGSDGPGSNQ